MLILIVGKVSISTIVLFLSRISKSNQLFYWILTKSCPSTPEMANLWCMHQKWHYFLIRLLCIKWQCFLPISLQFFFLFKRLYRFEIQFRMIMQKRKAGSGIKCVFVEWWEKRKRKLKYRHFHLVNKKPWRYLMTHKWNLLT